MGSAREVFPMGGFESGSNTAATYRKVQQAIVDVYQCAERAKKIAAEARERLKTLLSGTGTACCPFLISIAMKGKLYESEYEEALIDMLHAEGWQYSNGKTIKNRPYREPLLVDELRESLSARYPELTSEDVEAIENRLRHAPGQSHFERLRNTFQLVRDGYRYVRNRDGKKFDVKLVNFDRPERNSYRVVNQLEVGYGLKMMSASPMCFSHQRHTPLYF